MEPRNRSGELAVDQLRVRRPLLSLSTATTTSSSSSTATTTATTHLKSSSSQPSCSSSSWGCTLATALTAERLTGRHGAATCACSCTPLQTISTLLPAVAYSSIEGKAQDCAVCLSEFEGKDAVKVILCCGHVFRQECIDRWLDSQGSCPGCRPKGPRPELANWTP